MIKLLLNNWQEWISGNIIPRTENDPILYRNWSQTGSIRLDIKADKRLKNEDSGIWNSECPEHLDLIPKG